MADSAITFTAGEVSTYYASRVPHLKHRGGQWRGVCPLHQGKRFSFSVNSETGCWYCFADCGRGGSLIDFEMTLTGADFMTALGVVCAIVGRPMPERARMTRGEWRTAQDAREREKEERIEVLHFADAAAHLAEDVLEKLDPFDQERAVHTRLIANLRKDARAVYRDWHERDPKMTAALVEAGRRADWRQQTSLLHLIEEMAQENYRHAA